MEHPGYLHGEWEKLCVSRQQGQCVKTGTISQRMNVDVVSNTSVLQQRGKGRDIVYKESEREREHVEFRNQSEIEGEILDNLGSHTLAFFLVERPHP